jgi:ribose 5-phosphate isomerase B
MRIVLASEFNETIERRIVLASDHAGFTLKAAIADHLRAAPGHEIVDIGTYNTNPVDYPPICAAAARLVVSGEAEFAVVIGGSGQGEQIAANKVRGIRAALCHDEYTARFARLHNDANVLSLGARLLAPELACAILDVFLETEFEGGRHAERLAQLAEIEAQESEKQRTSPATVTTLKSRRDERLDATRPPQRLRRVGRATVSALVRAHLAIHLSHLETTRRGRRLLRYRPS